MVKRKQQGFTIIEVVLVLAIAGLIFLMVFIALPALQRGQRDTGRKNDVSTVASALNTFLSNNKGSFTTPTALTSGLLQGYIDSLSQYDVSSVTVNAAGTTAATAATGTIQVTARTQCPASLPAPGTLTMTLVGGTARQAAIFTALENNGTSSQVFCQNI